MSESEMDETIREFLVEARENMEQAYKDLDELKANPDNIEPVRSLFRAIHSIKGASGFFNFSTLEGVAHFCEAILSEIRDGKMKLTPGLQSLLYEGADAVSKTIDALVESGSEGEEAYIELIMRLRDASQGGDVAPAKEAAAESTPVENTVEPETAPESSGEGVMSQADLDVALEDSSENEEEESEEEEEESVTLKPSVEANAPAAAAAPAPAPAAGGAKAAETPAASSGASHTETSIRVDVSLLDTLMNRVEELVLSRNQILRHTSLLDNNDLANACQVFSLVTSELQEGIMKTRMQPVSNVFSKFPRIVRDVARSCEKEVNFKTEGEETELDRTIIEAIKDPLTHIVRNSIDHGIEKPDVRIANDKPEAGTLLMRAFHEGGQVVIEIIDDGAGINTDRVREKALERGLITQQQAAAMTSHEINNLIFLPGFSTVQVVSNLSGRGVGMDVVRTNIEKIGGTADLNSEQGVGTTLRISIPLTLAIVPALIVTACGERFAIPQVNLQELVRLEGGDVATLIEHVSGAETYRLRGDLLPLLRLSEILRLKRPEILGDGLSPDGEAGGKALSGNAEKLETASGKLNGAGRKEEDVGLNVLVLASGNSKYGLIVDRVHDIEEVVVKPLSKHMNSVVAYAGATILGDGKVILILDTAGLAVEAKVKFDSIKEEISAKNKSDGSSLRRETQSLLLFSVAEKEQFAIPLALISRLEKFPASEISHAGGKEVIQYRGRILPLLRFEEHLPISRPEGSGEEINVIVFRFEDKEVGLVVTEIVDVAEINIDLDNSTFTHSGILGSSIVNGRTTLFLDIFSIVGEVYPKWFVNKTQPMGESGAQTSKDLTILLAEDSQFFRTIIRSYLEAKDYKVVEADDGAAALKILESGQYHIDLVVTDVEMPNMTGFELTERIRASERYKDLPIMALTSLASDEDRERGLKAGVDEYCVKLDRSDVLDVVGRLAQMRHAAVSAT